MSSLHSGRSNFTQQRAWLARLLVLVILLVLVRAYYGVQIERSSDYKLRSDENRIRVLPFPAPRGVMFDRHGKVIAETTARYSLYLEPAAPDTIQRRLQRLAYPLGLDSSAIQSLAGKAKARKNEALLITSNLRYTQHAYIAEHLSEFPGVHIEETPARHYPEGEAVAHLIGYVAEISKNELQDTAYAGYKMGQNVGKAGLERAYQFTVGGQPGTRYVEVDARGRIVGRFEPRTKMEPVAGQDLRLTLDVELQRFAHRIFPKDKKGSIVAMVPSTGEILALYSHPTFDPNELTGGVSPKLWKALNQNKDRPLLNRATHGIYPPGSTWKIATAMIALEANTITPDERMPLACNGGMSYAGRYSRCWYKEGHGSLDLAGAIAHSCNVYFYQVGIRLGLKRLTEEGTRLGFNRKTGIDLPTEKKGTFPYGTEWYEKNFGWKPTPSEVMSLAIGQGPNAQTPLRMAQFFSAVAGDGTARTPHLVIQDTAKLPIETNLKVSEETLAAVWNGMARVMEPGGTAYMSSLKRWKMYGKTGTSQNTEDPKKPHGWFTGFAGPHGGKPEIVVSVIVEFGESGSGAAAPLAAKVADFYLNQKYGFRTDSLQTLRERLSAGVP